MVGQTEHALSAIIAAKFFNLRVNTKVRSHISTYFTGSAMGAEVLLEIPQGVICIKIGLAVQTDEFSKRVDNTHDPIDFLAVFGHARVDFKKVNGNNFPGVRAMLDLPIPIFVLGVVYGFG